MDDFYTRRDTSAIAPTLFRLAVIVAFLALIWRLYDLQVSQSEKYAERADRNRTKIVETLAPRGVIYDSAGQLLVRNKARFQVEVVPSAVAKDDDATEDVNEELEAIRAVLDTLNARNNEKIAVRIAEAMFIRLGRCDYVDAVEEAINTKPRMIQVRAPDNVVPTPCDPEEASTQNSLAELTGSGDEEGVSYFEIPDTDSPLPLAGLEALIQRAVSIKRFTNASDPIPLLIVDQAVAFDVMEASYQLPSVQVAEVPIRSYIHGPLLSHAMGFMGAIPEKLSGDYREEGYNDLTERVGISGIEAEYQEFLRGEPGISEAQVNIFGHETGVYESLQPPTPGQNVHLTIDLELQRTMQDELQAMMDEKDAWWGVTIAMDPMTGKVLGLVSLPSFDNNIFNGELGEEYNAVFRDERKPLINYAISSMYPPGSVFKLVVGAGALQEGVVSPSSIIVDRGPIYLRNRFNPDDLSVAQRFVSWNHAPHVNVNHGRLNMTRAIAWSNDIYFYYIGGGFPETEYETSFTGLGDERMIKWSRQFGYGAPTGIDIPGEGGGIIPDREWKRRWFAQRWTTGDSYNMSIGQGFVAVTPLQVLVATAAIVNGGKVLKPQLVDKITDVSGTVFKEMAPDVSCDVTQGCPELEQFAADLTISPSHLDTVRVGMWEAVNTEYGTAVDARIGNIITAGKTGTAEFCDTRDEVENCGRDDDAYLPTHSWYVGYAPYDQPEIAVVTFIYNGGEGSEAALPVTRRIMEAHFGIQPDSELAVTD